MSRRSAKCARALLVLLPALAAGRAEAAPGPGAEPYPAELQRRIDGALAARGDGYRARTRHLDERGRPLYTNRLILETSPYLLQHAHNPVDWYPWGDEAFEAARRLGRPVLLSVGYSTCHWCHVMEEESFEDEEIAAYLNEHYVAIKVDREERPDVDSIYMSAVQLLTGRGGWPMTLWLTPDREPFFGGTYFPPRDGVRGARRGLLGLLQELARAYREGPDEIAAQTRAVTRRVRESMLPVKGEELPGAEAIGTALERYRERFDASNGGLRGAPKFPSSLPLRLLLRRAQEGDGAQEAKGAAGERDAGDALLEMARLTLDRMAAGGIYDHVGGGFHRYATDADWLVPHFEKMLYDNALLARAYLEAYQLLGDESHARVAREILRYVAREMTAPGGGFYSATDADSASPEGEPEEGRFYTWTPAELARVLGAEESAFVGAYYGVTAQGNFEGGRSILHVTRPLAEVAAEHGIAPAAARARLESDREKLYAARAKRPAPLRDDKILTSWNGLMISAFANGGFVLGDPELISRAERAATFVLERSSREGRLLRTYPGGGEGRAGFLDDYAFLIGALIDLYEATSNPTWFERAIELQAVQDAHYADAAGGYFLTADDHERLLVREKPLWDGAEPSGNSVAALNLLRLAELTGDDAYRARADRLFRAAAPSVLRNPPGHAELLLALDFEAASPREVVIVTREGRREAQPFLAVLRENYLPHRVLAVAAEGEIAAQSARIPLLRGKVARDGRPTAYVCEQGRCRLPTDDPTVFARQLLEPEPRGGAE